MFPGLHFHLQQLLARTNQMVMRRQTVHKSTLVWNDLGQVEIVIPSCHGYMTLHLEQITIVYRIAHRPLSSEPFGWIYKDIEQT